MAVFNSLGSNYSTGFAFGMLFARRKKNAQAVIEQTIGDQYAGRVTLTYKGREALELALRQAALPQGSAVGINGFTCFVVYQAVKNAGYQPIFLDVPSRHLNFSLDQLKAVHIANTKLRAIIIQNTLGYPADMASIASYCHKQGIMIIEDLAHSLGAKYAEGQPVGTVGSFTMMSFSQDKPLDIVAGGALIDRRSSVEQPNEQLPYISAWQRWVNRQYPFWTLLIRGTYTTGLGKLLHHALKTLRLLATPMSDSLQGLHAMYPTDAQMLGAAWAVNSHEIQHRQAIAAIYEQELADLLCQKSSDGVASYLRFPLWVDGRASLIDYLKARQIYIGDTWYDAPVAPKRYLAQTSYTSGQCPNAEALATHIVNLPTHRSVTPEVARNICATIKQWQALQSKT